MFQFKPTRTNICHHDQNKCKQRLFLVEPIRQHMLLFSPHGLRSLGLYPNAKRSMFGNMGLRHVFVQTVLIDFYASVGKVFESRRVFDEMPERDFFTWTTMTSGFLKAGDLDSSRRLFDETPERSTTTWNAMIDGYARVGNVVSDELLFNQMPAKDTVSWTTMINCYSRNKQFGEALALFEEMRRYKVSPDEVTMSSVISACAHLGALETGKEIHNYLMQNSFDLDVYIGSALIGMYAKCGSLERSLLVFFKLREKNLFCWNSVIEGLAVHDHAVEALAMFDRMEKQHVEPNGVTFISVLSACNHAGLVEVGRQMFLSMTRDYSIPPESNNLDVWLIY